MGTVANTADGIDIQKWSDFPEDGIEFDWTRLINHTLCPFQWSCSHSDYNIKPNIDRRIKSSNVPKSVLPILSMKLIRVFDSGSITED